MYRNSYQRGMLTIFFSVGSKPLAIWDTHTQDGYITRFLDQDIKSMVLEIGGTNVSTTYITCPKGNKVLGITMPFLVMIVKNLKKYFSFEVTILDETLTRRRFRVSNFQSSTQILPLCTVMPIGLSDGWNQIQFNLAEFTRRAYKKQYVEVQKLKINANIRLRRIYFTERLVPEDELPPEYKLYFPLTAKGAKDKKVGPANGKENVKPSTSKQLIQQRTSQESLKNRIDIVKISKTSVHTLKKVSSQESRKESKNEIKTETAEEEATKSITSVIKHDESKDKIKIDTAEEEATKSVTSVIEHAEPEKEEETIKDDPKIETKTESIHETVENEQEIVENAEQ